MFCRKRRKEGLDCFLSMSCRLGAFQAIFGQGRTTSKAIWTRNVSKRLIDDVFITTSTYITL